jgi:quinol monooxygenase YgiN
MQIEGTKSMTNIIEATAIIEVKAGHADEFESLLIEFETQTNKEEGCLEFRFFREIGESNRFVLWEVFQSQEALTKHMEMSHTKEIFSKGLIESTNVIKHRKVV